MKVLKFGGSSLADQDQFEKVREIIHYDEDRRYVVVSAPGKGKNSDHKVTDLLLMCYQLATHGLNVEDVFKMVKEIYHSIVDGLGLDIEIADLLADIQAKIQAGADLDYTLSRGEYLNAKILAEYLGWEFVDAQDMIVFDGKKLSQEETNTKIQERLEGVDRAVIPGFYGANQEGEITTFSRGGSDITGSLVAKALNADVYENWTDVSGFLVADPRIVDNPKTIDYITYEELRELSYLGAPVLHEDAIFPIKEVKIPINIRNTNAPKDPGTTILQNGKVNTNPITGIAGTKDYTAITIEKNFLNSEVGIFRKMVSVFETNNVSIEHTPTGVDTISVIASTTAIGDKRDKIVEEIKIYTRPDVVKIEEGIAIIAIVGRNLKGNTGAAGKIFTALGNSGINIKMISQGSSEMNVIVGVSNKDFEKAIKAIYNEFY